MSFVMSDLISDVKSAFVANRQILDWPFILNEFLSWCKHKKLKTMIFKIEFEKAFDYVRWDYLDDVLKAFGFSDKWRGWISGCLKTATGSVLVNGSPTSELCFHKGLKQGDPLFPFLFILIMVSLHVSFGKILDAGLFKEEVDKTARIVRCFRFFTPFHYLGVKVGSVMSKISSWDEVKSKVYSRLSKWKLNSISIGDSISALLLFGDRRLERTATFSISTILE
ncbi:RNA-directed DNA polymerase, eukaryota [Tanacetum coccineum]